MGKNYLTKKDYDAFEVDDTRYYGLFCDKKRKVKKIDPKRFQQATWHSFTKEQLSVINSRQTHFFYPVKEDYYDYYCNQFEKAIQTVREYWETHHKPLIVFAKERINKPKEMHPSDCELLMNGIYEPDEGIQVVNITNARNNARYSQECAMVVANLYAQFIHYFASSIESVTVSILSAEKAIDDHFDRNSLYATAINTGKTIQELPSFSSYDKLYGLWNFIKHNSASTYEKMEKVCPEALFKRATYRQGELATRFICFSDDMIISLINGVSQFFKEYCELVFHENYEVAQWNYGSYFYSIVDRLIEDIVNPLGISPFL